MSEEIKKVSVVIPTYKREGQYLLRAIESILKQTYLAIEVVVVDDNPRDSSFRMDTMELMQRFKDDPRIVYIMNPVNVGGAVARNNGIAKATGDYITFLDDDDEYLPKKIEQQLNFMQDEDCDMSFTNLTLVNENKEVVDFRDHSYIKDFSNENLLKVHLMRNLTGTPTFMYKAEKLREIGGFDDVKVSQEFYLMFKTIQGGLKIRHLNESGVIAYRHAMGGISQGETKIKGEKDLFAFKKQYFHLFNRKEQRFIKFRYLAVLTFSYLRNKAYLKAVGTGIQMLFTSPMDLVREGRTYMQNKKNKSAH